MSFPKQIRISQSVLVAQEAITQALEVLMGQVIVLNELTVTLGKITKHGTSRHRRRISISGCARTKHWYEVGGPHPLLLKFRFYFANIPLVEYEYWCVDKEVKCDLTIDNSVVNGKKKDYVVFWKDGLFYSAESSGECRMWTIGKTWEYQRKEPVIP